jgi:hypothetical protein
MRSHQFSLLALMILVAATALLAWMARSDTGRISLIATGIVIGGLIVGGWLSRVSIESSISWGGDDESEPTSIAMRRSRSQWDETL